MLTLSAARADFELTDANGRRILLKDDGTWRYADARPAGGVAAAASAADKSPTKEGLAELQLTAKRESSGQCLFEFGLTNHYPYEIRSLIPSFKIYRSSGAVYVEEFVAFSRILPGNQQLRSVLVGLDCASINKLQVGGGDRCDMGDLNRFSDVKGECLRKLSVKPSALVTLEK